MPKCDPRVEAYGEVDELNAAVGLALVSLPARSRFRPWLGRVQNDLFDLGAALAIPDEPAERPRLRVTREQVEWLDRACEQANNELAPLRTFVLLGGSEASARLHLARTSCRRAERRSVALARREPVNPHLLAYLNRLGDLLFILARSVDADSGERPRLWRPGAGTLARAAERILPDPLSAPPANV
ncbi:MAG TPA: cob(I)yrinic acid a,c-diamide adenosyltransferase [Gaiellaceae bacterium]|nr:cob(I)yrinic acid a,c-diamide adenosyltransferase [Gaiellaceae bacterium]